MQPLWQHTCWYPRSSRTANCVCRFDEGGGVHTSQHQFCKFHRQETVEVVWVLVASVALGTGCVLHAAMLGSDGTVVKS